MPETLMINGSEYYIQREIIPAYAGEGQRLLVLADQVGRQLGLVCAEIVANQYQVDDRSLTIFKDTYKDA